MISPFKGSTRKHQRLVHVVAFAYRSDHRSPEMHFGVTSNISASGMCIYSDVRLGEGQYIEFRSSLPVDFRKAMVKWIRKDVNNLYKMGVMFVE